MSTIATSGKRLVDEHEQVLGVAGLPDDLEAVLLEQRRDAFAEQHRVVGEHDAERLHRGQRPGSAGNSRSSPSATMRRSLVGCGIPFS